MPRLQLLGWAAIHLLTCLPAVGASPAPVSLRALLPSREIPVSLDPSPVSTRDELIDLAVEIEVGALARSENSPLVVVFVIDVSGSMKGEKIVQTRKAVNSVLAGLQPEDRLSLTTFSYLAEDLYSPPGPPDLDRARSMVEGLQAGGGTNMVDGLRLGMQKLQELSRPGSVKRILLLGDGDANLGSGDMTRIAAWARDHDAAVSSFGVGEGFDAKTMEEIARASGGNFYSIQDEQKLHEVFGRELDQMRRTAGDQAQLVIKPSFGLGVVEVLGRPSWLEAGPGVISLPSLTAGTHQTVEVRLRRHSRTPVPGTRGRIDVHLDFLDESLGDARQVHGHTEFLWTQEVTP